MSQEIHAEEHSSPIKTPKQLIIVVVLAFAIPIALISMIVSLVTSSATRSAANAALSEDAIAERLQPVGQVVVADATKAQGLKTGKEVVESVCAACHVTGALNAPKVGDKAAWAKLIQEGQETLTADAMKGIRQMPPRGGAPDLSDIEFARAVAYMANQAGANWKEPDPKPGTGGSPATTAAAPAAAPAVAAAAPAPAPAPAAPAAAAGADTGKGKAVYEAACMVCHAAGVAGAPKTGDKAAWAPRLKSGMDTLYATAIKGKGAMPPKGGNASLSDADVKAAVDYMVGLVK